jgi:Na+-translocating ferredoxin:NAD+ oxidoreductase RnfC subunit
MLHVDKTAMELWAPLILRGLFYAMRAADALKGVIGIKSKNHNAVKSLEDAIKKGGYDKISLCLLDNYYPAGDEHNLVNEVTGKVIPELGLPLSRGAVVFNVTTLLNMALAIEHDIPVTHRTVTIAGEVKQSMTLLVPVGTRVEHVIQFAGHASSDNFAVIDGGPMMGNPVSLKDAVISKATSGILVLPEDHYVIRKKTMPIEKIIAQSKTLCCQCRYCTDLCPRFLLGHRLEPHQIMRSVNYALVNDIEKIKGAVLCSECGICAMYACFMDLSPTLMNRAIKQEFAKKGFKPDMNFAPVRPREFMDTRKIPVSRLVNKIGVSSYMERGPFIEDFPVPPVLEIPLSRHIGAPAQACVKKGDTVKAGQIIGLPPEKGLGAAVHSSADGVVSEIDSFKITVKTANVK